MTPPKETGKGRTAETPVVPSAVSVCLSTLKTRPEFLRAASARRQGTGGFLLQARCRNDDTARMQVGFTASKKIGNAVARNRAKRRLREVARAILPQLADLSRRTQVFLFTHHEHVVELFRQTLKEDQFSLHRFPGG